MIFDIGIIGCGIAGTFAALKISEKYKNNKCIVFDIGRPPLKRRRFLEGFLGCFPTGNGKIYPNNLNTLKQLMDGRKINPVKNWVMRYFKTINNMKLISDNLPSEHFLQKIYKQNLKIQLNDHYQWKPAHVHKLSKLIADPLLDSKNLQFSFDTYVENIDKNNDIFTITTENTITKEKRSVECKNVLLTVGRSGWRWATNLYDKFDLITDDNYSVYGVRIEIAAGNIKALNKSHCSLFNDDTEIGPFQWNGAIIPEDHSDLVISVFKSNEDRWKSDKLTFSLLKRIYNHNSGCAQTNRIGKLLFLLFNDRVSKEKIKTFIKGNSLLNLLPEYTWLNSQLQALEILIPNLCSKGYMHIPHIEPLAAKIKINKNLETELKGLYVAGESARIPGILGAAVSGAIAANNILG